MPSHARLRSLCTLAGAAVVLLAASAQAWIHDRNQDKIDDRITRVKVEGFSAAFDANKTSQRMVIGVFAGTPVRFGVYVGFDRRPTEADVARLQALGYTDLKIYRYIDYVRAIATYEQIEASVVLEGVTRIEAIPMIYPANHYGSRVVRARDSRGLSAADNDALFPSAGQELGLDGTGIVIGILDTGVNDAPDMVNPGYPGHQSLAGKFLGGGNFFSGQPLLNTALDASENPQDHGSEVSSYHATHVAGSALGTGGQDGFFRGVAPAARLVDCKVLSDAGAGFGSADGVEWCIANKNNTWGLTGDDLIYAGIDVLNLSLGSLTESDGTDAGSQMMNAAMNAGLAVCIATGNDSEIDYIASPAAADLCISVGATSHGKTVDRADDRVTSFSNEGPRQDDGDADHLDEMKPSVVAPGAGILSADGDVTSSGGSYKQLSGTSMATPHVAGVCALLRQANPSLTPLQLRTILQNTAEHDILSVKGDRANDPFGVDPNYDPGCGWGLVDAYAAAKEALDSTTGVQVVQLRALARPQDGEIDFRWVTQREYPFQGFDVYRAPDAAGVPGTFTKLNGPVLIAPAGDPVIEADDNRTPYLYVDDAGLTLGTRYWYRVDWIDLASNAHSEPPVSVTFGTAGLEAIAYYSIAHNAPDNDLLVKVGRSVGYDPTNAQFLRLGPGEAGQDSFQIIGATNAATAAAGNIEHFWSIPLSAADGVAPFLPPSVGNPWFLDVTEGGFINRAGRVNGFSVFVVNSPGAPAGTTYFTDTMTPQPTVETQRVTLWIPDPGPVSDVGVANLSAQGEDGAVRIVLEFANPLSGASAIVSRSATRDAAARRPLMAAPEPFEGARFEFVDRAVRGDLTFSYWVEVMLANGNVIMNGPVSGTPAGSTRTTLAIATGNPMRERAVFQYTVGADPGNAGGVPVSLVVHDVRGRIVRTLERSIRETGRHELTWNARDDDNRRVAQGVYYVRFQAGETTRTRKVTVVH